MKLTDTNIDISRYKSQSQIIRVLTESWVGKNSYCPNCCTDLTSAENNSPVCDYYCSECKGEFELKSKRGKLGRKVVDGSFSSMMARIQSANNPHFYFLSYESQSYEIKDLLVVPNYYFTPLIIEKRNPLPVTAKRAGWICCNIILESIPQSGRISLMSNGTMLDKGLVQLYWNKTKFLEQSQNLNSRTWLLETIKCLEIINKDKFTLDDVYKFEHSLKFKFPNNNHIKDKLRQQLQILRDEGMINFNGRGIYSINKQ